MSREIREELPRHRVPAAAKSRAARPSLQLTGLVTEPRTLTAAELGELARVELTESFRCEEGWSVPNLVWGGVRLADVIGLARRLPAASWVRVIAGPYAVPLALPLPEGAILATDLNGQPLSVEHGGPWRLVVPSGACFTSVKWVGRLELAAEAGEKTGESIARARLGAST